MNNIPARIKNRFDFKLQSITDGSVKEYTSYNIVLNSYFNAVVSGSLDISYIHIGNGTGTPAVTDTSLFGFLGAVYRAAITTNTEYPTSSATRSITLEPSQYVGSITEVGLGGSTRTSLKTHSMLVDSENNPIVINKTATDILTITSTIYVTLNAESSGAVLPSASESLVLAVCLGTSTPSTSTSVHFNGSKTREMFCVPGSSVDKASVTRTTDLPNRRWIYSTGRLDYNVGNLGNKGRGTVIKSIGAPAIAMWNLPNPNVFTPVSLTNLSVGTGDGETTEYYMPIPECVDGSQVIRVGGEVKILGTDYTFHNINAKDFTQMLISADAYYQSGTGSYNPWLPSWPYFHPCAYMGTNGNNTLPAYTNKPIYYDFSEPVHINYAYCAGYGKSSSASVSWITELQYSDDNENWLTACSWTSSSNVTMMPKTLDITARYFRLVDTVANISCYVKTDPSDTGNEYVSGIYFGEIKPNIVFSTPPASGAAIEMDCTIDRPLKNVHHIIDFSYSVEFERE